MKATEYWLVLGWYGEVLPEGSDRLGRCRRSPDRTATDRLIRPRLGMVRLAEALGGPIGANYVSDVGWAAWVGDDWYDGKYLLLPDPPNGHCVEEFGGAHLAVQRGLASEVLVLPVPA